jgi:L-idonate 5-dehydrogenase
MGDTRAAALVVHGVRDLRIEPVELGEPAPGEAVVAVLFGGICGSDLHYWSDGRVGESVLREPMVLGHEVVAEVVEPAADGSGPAAGTVVAVHPAGVCGHCVWCRRGRRNLCTQLRYMGSAARFPHTPGAFQQLLRVPAARLVAFPPGTDLRRAALAEPTAVALHALTRAAAVGGQVRGANALVVGAGPIGLLAVAALRQAGAGRITATDLHDLPLRLAAAVGADATHRVGAPGSGAAAGAGEFDLVLETSGSAAGYAAAVAAAGVGAVVVSVGQLPGTGVTAPLHRTVNREIVSTGSSRFDGELAASVAALHSGALPVDPVVTHVVGLADAEAAFRLAADPATSSKVLLDLRR